MFCRRLNGKLRIKKAILIFLSCIMCLGGIPLLGADAPPFCQKMGLKKTSIGDTTVYYEPCFEEQLPVFKKAYKDYNEAVSKSKAQEQASVQKLMSLEDAIIEDINDIVGVDGDLKTFLKETLNGLVKVLPSTSGALTEKGSVFYLVLQSTSKDYLRAGGRLPNLSYDKKTDTAHYKLNFGSKSGEPLQRTDNLIPIASVDEFAVVTERIFAMLLEATGKVSTILEYLAIHEIAELAIVRKMKSGDPYKRWFTDGFANAITYEVILRRYSQETADSFLADFSTESYKAIENQSNLQYWMCAQYGFINQSPLEKENDFTYARYCFATQEAKRLVDSYGIEIVRKILDQYAGLEDKDYESLPSIIQKVTGEDPRKRFEKYQRFQTREEGYMHYSNQYEQAMKREDVKEMLFLMLRMVELCEQPFSKESLNLRKDISTLLYLSGQKVFANQFITDFADVMGQSKDPKN